MMSLRSFAVLCLISVASPALSLCGGASFADRLTDSELAEIASVRAATPYATGITWTAQRGPDQLTIIGTMHLRDPRLAPLMTSVTPQVDAAELILLEGTPAEEAQVMQYMTSNPTVLFSPDGPTLPEELTEETWQALSDAARARGIPPILASKMQPWYLMMTLGIPVCAMADLAANKRGLDQMVIERATARDIPMQALEPFDTIFDVLQDGTRAEQIEMLELSALDPEVQQEMFVAMLDSYFDGDVAGILKMGEIAARSLVDLPHDRIAELTAESEQSLLYDRNHNWIPVIEDAAQSADRIVIAVGAGHLPGEQGVLRLLENRGWTISPF